MPCPGNVVTTDLDCCLATPLMSVQLQICTATCSCPTSSWPGSTLTVSNNYLVFLLLIITASHLFSHYSSWPRAQHYSYHTSNSTSQNPVACIHEILHACRRWTTVKTAICSNSSNTCVACLHTHCYMLGPTLQCQCWAPHTSSRPIVCSLNSNDMRETQQAQTPETHE